MKASISNADGDSVRMNVGFSKENGDSDGMKAGISNADGDSAQIKVGF